LLFPRHSGAQIFAFDFGGSIRAAALAMGGDWHDLGGALSENAEERIERIDEYVEEAWAAEWIEAILAPEGVTITPEAKEHIWSAVTSLASAPASDARPNRCLLQIRPGRHCRRSRHRRPRELRVRLALAGG
jgi:type IV secretion system protein VirB4